MDDDVAAALAAAFPGRSVAAVDETGPSWNESNRTVRVTFADGTPVYLKLAVDGDPTGVRRERAAVDYVAANTGIPVPDVLAADPDAETPFLVTAPLDGTPMLEAWAEGDREAIARDLGATLATLHDHRFDRHGHVVDGDAGGLELDAGAWTDVLLDSVRNQRALARSDRYDEHFDRVLDAVEANRDLLDDAPAALQHGDPAKPNCVLTDDGIGLLDWELARVGDPVREVVRGRDQFLASVTGEVPDGLVAAYHEGYRERAGGLPAGHAERTPVYEAVRLLGVSGFFEDCLQFVDDSEAEFADWLETEMDRRLTAIA